MSKRLEAEVAAWLSEEDFGPRRYEPSVSKKAYYLAKIGLSASWHSSRGSSHGPSAGSWLAGSGCGRRCR